MAALIGDTNGFRSIRTLKAIANDPRVEEIEGGGMDEGRVFVHLKRGFWTGPYEQTHSISIGSGEKAKDVLSQIEVCNGECCREKTQ